MEFFPEGLTPINLVQFINNDGVSRFKLAYEEREASKGRIESLVTISRPTYNTGSSVSLYIHINGENVGIVENGREISIPVKNGRHTIMAVNSATRGTTQEVVFEADSMNVTFASGFNTTGLFIEKIKEEPFEKQVE